MASASGASGFRNRVFPAGLYALLLLAAFGLFCPDLLERPERWLRTVVSLPLRAYSLLGGNEVLAAPAPQTNEAAEGVFAHQRRTLLTGAVPPGPGYAPVVCAVQTRDRAGRFGSAELVLSVTNAEVEGCASMVTAGNRLLGFLRLAGPDERDEPARVQLLHRDPRRDSRKRSAGAGDALQVLDQGPPLPSRVLAELRTEDLPLAFHDRDDGLRMLVEPSARVEEWPLRCTSLDDPYLASRLRKSGAPVWTREMWRGSETIVPAGLRLGTLKVWGYPKLAIPVGLFVAPSQDPDAISAVVLWSKQQQKDPPAPIQQGTLHAVRILRLPSEPERWLCTASSWTRLIAGAALVQDNVLLGALHEPWSGQSLAQPLEATRAPFAALLVPNEPAAPVLEVRVFVLGPSADGRLRLGVRGEGVLTNGRLFTGANGRAFPAGFLIGDAQAVPGRRELLLRRPELVQTSGVVQLFVPEAQR